jgi:hypothetical protein
MFVSMITAGLLVYIGTAGSLTFGLKEYPHQVRGYGLGIFVGAALEFGILKICARQQPELLTPVFISIVLGIVFAGLYIKDQKF